MSADAQLFAGELVRDLAVFGQRLDVWVRPNEHEIARRAAEGVRAITSGEMIRTLMGLPAGIPLRMAELDPINRLIIDELGKGVVLVRNDEATRLVVPPVELVGFVKRARSWEDIQAISLLRTHAPRLVVASPTLAMRTLREADTDIGVTREDDGAALLRSPGTRWLKPSWQRWMITELAFEAWRSPG